MLFFFLFLLTEVISLSPPFQLATSVPVLDSIKEMVPVENATAINLSDGFTAMTRISPVVAILDFQVCKDV